MNRWTITDKPIRIAVPIQEKEYKILLDEIAKILVSSYSQLRNKSPESIQSHPETAHVNNKTNSVRGKEVA